jgi:hypothetical protein
MELNRGVSSCEQKAKLSWRFDRNQGGWSSTSILGSRLVKAMSTGLSAVIVGNMGHSGIGGAGEVSRRR